MSEEITDDENQISELKDKAREKFASVQECANEALSTTEQYIRANPWVAVAGAVLLGGALVALSKNNKPKPTKLDAVRDWIDDMYAKIPNQKQVQAAADSSGVPCFLNHLKKRFSSK